MDFDGDAMAGVLMLDNQMSRQAEKLAPHKNVIDHHTPRSLTNVAAIPKPVASTIINWLRAKDRTPDMTPEQQLFMQSLYV